MNEIYDWEDRVSIKKQPQDRSSGYSDKNQHLVVGITGRKVKTMYQKVSSHSCYLAAHYNMIYAVL